MPPKYPKYRLHYFNSNSRAEPIRILFNYGKIPFEDVRYEFSDWETIKRDTPLHQLPYLEVDDEIYTQTYPICRYLANIVNLAGNNIEENLYIDGAVEMITELVVAIDDYKRKGEIGTRKEKFEAKFINRSTHILAFLNKNVPRNGGYIAINRLTWADVIFAWMYEYASNKLLPQEDIFANYPNLKQVVKNVLKEKNIREWIQKRPKRPYDLEQDL